MGLHIYRWVRWRRFAHIFSYVILSRAYQRAPLHQLHRIHMYRWVRWRRFAHLFSYVILSCAYLRAYQEILLRSDSWRATSRTCHCHSNFNYIGWPLTARFQNSFNFTVVNRSQWHRDLELQLVTCYLRHVRYPTHHVFSAHNVHKTQNFQRIYNYPWHGYTRII